MCLLENDSVLPFLSISWLVGPEWMNEWMNEWMEKWINEWMNDKELIACFQRNSGQYLQYLRNAWLVMDRRMDRWMDKQMERQTEGLTNWYMNRHTDQWTDRQTDAHKIRHLSLSRRWENDNFSYLHKIAAQCQFTENPELEYFFLTYYRLKIGQG